MMKCPGRIAFAALVIVAGFLAGCGSSGASGGAPTVTVWTWRSQDAPLWKKVQAALNKKGVKVNIQFRAINPTSYDSVTLTAFDGGRGPDIFYARAGSGTINYAYAHMIAPLDGVVNFSNVKSYTLPDVTYSGKRYGVPFAVQTMGVFYNKAIFSKYHLSPPKTWADFISICKTLQSHGVTPIAAMGVQAWMLSLDFDEVGATMMNDSFTRGLVNRTNTYDSAPYINALAHYQQLAPYLEKNFQAVGSADNEQESDVALGRAAMTLDGIFDVPTMQSLNHNLKLGSFLIPPVDSSQTTKVDWYTDGDIAMNSHIANAAERKAAQQIVKFTATKQFGQWFAGIAGEISPISGVKIPATYPLSIQAYHWFQTIPINPIFDIRSPMDIPPPMPPKKAAAVTTTQGVFSSEQAVMLPLLEGKLTPSQAAAKVQKSENWYFHK